MPTKMWTAAASASGPSSPMARRSSSANTAVSRCSTPQWNSSADSALITSTRGRILNARMTLLPGRSSGKGRAPPPR